MPTHRIEFTAILKDMPQDNLLEEKKDQDPFDQQIAVWIQKLTEAISRRAF